MSNENELNSIDDIVSHMKKLMKQYIDLCLYNNALFYADKIFYLTLNKDHLSVANNLYDLAQCYFYTKEYYRCVNIIQKYNMTYYNLKFLNLIGMALLACDDYESVITFLDKENINFEYYLEQDIDIYLSVRHLITAKAYEMQENKPPAIKNYIKALIHDPGNIEAFEILINHNLLSSEQKVKLTQDMKFNDLNKWLYDYYVSKSEDNIYITDKSDVMDKDVGCNILYMLYNNNDQDLMKIEAEKFFINRDYLSSYNMLKKLNDEDFYKTEIIPMYCVCLIELNKIGELYHIAHKLANSCSEKYISWYAVGCYYYCIKKYDIARKYFVKCNQLNKHFPEGWIALGNSYAAQDESDQALSAYRTCLRLFPGCHYANLYLGMEYIRSNNLKTALTAFKEALMISSKDPLVYNEVGVVFYKQKIYDEALTHFQKGLELCKEDRSQVFQTIVINLAHCYRKLRHFDLAINYYEQVLVIDNRNLTILSSLGYTHHLKGDYRQALDIYHKVNFIKSDDQQIVELINRCMNDLLDSGCDNF